MNTAKIDKMLKELALTDWDEFLLVTGLDKVQITICVERKRKKSIRQIAQKTGLPKSTVSDKCKKCPNLSDGKGATRKN